MDVAGTRRFFGELQLATFCALASTSHTQTAKRGRTTGGLVTRMVLHWPPLTFSSDSENSNKASNALGQQSLTLNVLRREAKAQHEGLARHSAGPSVIGVYCPCYSASLLFNCGPCYSVVWGGFYTSESSELSFCLMHRLLSPMEHSVVATTYRESNAIIYKNVLSLS